MGEQNKPKKFTQEGKPLGAAEMIKPFIEQVTEPDGTILDVIAPGRAAVISEQYADQQTAALREELEAVKKERDTFGQNVEMFRQEVKKRTDFADWVTRQRDEALDIASELLSQLKYVQEKFIQTGSTPGVITQCETRISRLSSGETKPVSPWISVEERLPEIGEAVFVWNESVDIAEYCHDNTGHPRFFYDNESWFHSVELWQPITLPAPPESLTDKDTTNE